MEPELRELVYLNEVSLNNHLSSLGEGLPQEVIQEIGSERERSGSAEANLSVPFLETGIGGGGEISHLGRDSMQTRMKITAPYQLQTLLELITENENFKMYGNEELGDASRGDVVKLKGQVNPMSLFKYEVMIKLFLSYFDLFSDISEIDPEQQPPGGSGPSFDEEGDYTKETFQKFNKIIKKLIGDQIPIRIEGTDINLNVGVPLQRNFLKTTSFRTFMEERYFVLFGRVLERVRGVSNRWRPLDFVSMSEILLGEGQANIMIEELRKALDTDQVNLEFREEDKFIETPGAVVFPIAMFW